MDLETFENDILMNYNNRKLSLPEINEICMKAISNKILDKSDIHIPGIPECNTTDLLNFIKKCRSSYLTKSIKLNESENEESFISSKYHSPISNYTKTDITQSPFYNHKRSVLDSPHMNKDYKKNINKTPLFNSPLVNKNTNIENPFSDGNDFESFCEDLRTKTSSIRKKSDEKSAKIINDVIDSFVQYKLKRRPENRYLILKVCLLSSAIALFYCLFTFKPT
ncbi:hypothetical protein P3W45_001361 [Vairimorpha bombi]|jgi:hypothetical protein